MPTDETRRRAFVVRTGRLVPIPEGFYLMSPRKLLPLLRSPLLSLRGKLRLLAEPFVPRGPHLAPSEPKPGRRPSRRRKCRFVCRRRLGREVFERFVQPLVAGIYTADPEKLSMAATMPQFLEFERNHSSFTASCHRSAAARNPTGPAVSAAKCLSRTRPSASGARYGLFLAPKHGLQCLVEKLADWLPNDAVHLEHFHREHRSTRQNMGLSLRIRIRDPTSSLTPIIAVPAYAAAKLLSSSDCRLAAELATIEYAGCAVVSLGFHRSQIGHALDGFGFVVPQIENPPHHCRQFCQSEIFRAVLRRMTC